MFRFILQIEVRDFFCYKKISPRPKSQCELSPLTILLKQLRKSFPPLVAIFLEVMRDYG